MYTKYYTIEIPDTKKMQAECKRRRILRRRIRTACGVAGFLSFFYLFGIVGGLEQDMLTIKQAIIHGVVAIGIMAASIEITERL
jgi:hypothetical protein